MTADVSIFAALLAGVLSFLSPCVLPLVPPYLVYLAGASLERLAEAEPEPAVRKEAVFAALLFVAGFSTVFTALGASASAIGALISAWSAELGIVAGIIIIVMGLHFLGLTRLDILLREKRARMPHPVGLWGAYVMGLAFAFGWTPCIGPILAAILAVAASKDTVARGRDAVRGLLGRARHSLHSRGARRRAVRRLPREVQAPSRTGREGHGWVARAYGNRLSHRVCQRGQLLPARMVPRPGQDRVGQLK